MGEKTVGLKYDGEVLVTIAVTKTKLTQPKNMRDAITQLKAAGMRVRLLSTCEQEDGVFISTLSHELGIE
ncbi:MAG: hypothetical protein HC845_00105 [Akkermansiaceae bacterium]|nr:hypothetical protein [Akkermansiaceae bacterium]